MSCKFFNCLFNRNSISSNPSKNDAKPKPVTVRSAEICDMNGNVVFLVINRPYMGQDYKVDPRSTQSVRIYFSNADKPNKLYFRKCSFKKAIKITRDIVFKEEKHLLTMEQNSYNFY